jgi:hypothetical protein
MQSMTSRAFRLGLVCWYTTLLSSQGIGQERLQGDLQDILKHLGAAAESLEHSLPNMSCKENGTSEWHISHGLWHSDDFTATMRVKRTPAGRLAESYQLTSVNGKEVSGNEKFELPLYVTDGFDRALRYFLPSSQTCYRYTSTGNKVSFESIPSSASKAPCPDSGVSGFAVLDAEGNVNYLERRVSQPVAKQTNVAPLAKMDFRSIELDGHTYWITKHLSSEELLDGAILNFEVNYSDCHLFTTTVKIEPAVSVQ